MKKGEWFDKAYDYFVRYYYFREFDKIGRRDYH